MGRKIPFENVVNNLRFRRTTYTRLCNADYSNLGVELFDEKKFADNLGVTSNFLKEIGLLKIENQAGWNLLKCPTADELLKFRDLIKEKAEVLKCHN